MKNYMLIFLFLITISIYAQKDSGVVLYKVLSREEVRASEIIEKISIIASEITFKPIDTIKQNFKGTVISETDYKKKISEIDKSIGF